MEDVTTLDAFQRLQPLIGSTGNSICLSSKSAFFLGGGKELVIHNVRSTLQDIQHHFSPGVNLVYCSPIYLLFIEMDTLVKLSNYIMPLSGLSLH